MSDMIEMNKPLECDVLVAGGGVAGLMAAIAAAEEGAKVIVAEKANSKRSGSGATGNDHFLCYIPAVHGDDPSEFIREMEESQIGGNNDMDLVRRYVAESFNRVKDWDSWGVGMREHGDWEFNGHAKPGHLRVWLKYAGREQKPIFTREAIKRGVTILNHHPFADVITDGHNRVAGGICIDITGEVPKMQVIRAKSVVLATGSVNRLFGAKTMGWMFNNAGCPSDVCTGRAAAYRAGARLVNLDRTGTGAGCKYFNRGGKATWLGVYSDISGKPLGPFVTKPSKEYGDLAGDIWHDMFSIKRSQGEPVFMNCSECTDEQLDYMLWGLSNEGNVGTLDHLASEGFDFRKHMVEFDCKDGGNIGGGIDISVDAQCTVDGLFAAGDETGNFRADMGGAATYGHIAGVSAACYSRGQTLIPAEEMEIVTARAHHYSEIISRDTDTATPDWREINVAIQQVMTDYCGPEVRSEHILTTGLSHLKRLQAKAATVHCADSHEFMRCLEAEDLALLGELAFVSALERKETRGKHNRVDYPFTNPLLNNKFVTVEKVNGVPSTGWRDKHK